MQGPSSTFQENECKWVIESASDYARFLGCAGKLGATVESPRDLNISDHYLDTVDRFFTRAHTRCRLREVAGNWVLTFKDDSDALDEVFSRRERNFELMGVGSESAALSFCDEFIFPGIRAGLSVQCLFTITNQRESRDLTFPGDLVAEVSFDQVRMNLDDDSLSAMELELELKRGSAEQFSTLARELTQLASLTPLRLSKYDRAADFFSVDTGLEQEAEYRFAHERSLQVAAGDIIRREAMKVRMSEPGVRVGVYPDAIHDMRVACRRIRSASRTFRDCYPKGSGEVFKEVAWLGKTLGYGRDLEVHTDTLKETASELTAGDQEALEPYWVSMTRRFDGERDKIMDILNSQRYRDILEGLEQIARATLVVPVVRDSPAASSVAVAGPHAIEDCLGKVITRVPGGTAVQDLADDEMHKLRIKLKRVRYLCEFFLRVSAPGVGELLLHTKALQKILGLHQDYRVGRDMVLSDREDASEQDLKGALARLAEVLGYRKNVCRQDFARAWPGYSQLQDKLQL